MRSIHKFVFVLVCLFLASCHHHIFTATDIKAVTASHHTIAVLPFNISYSGALPKHVDDHKKLQMQLVEGKAFQQELFRQLNEEATKGKLRVSIQPAITTNKLITEKGLEGKISTMAPAELSKLLGVDAVVISNVEKEKFIDMMQFYDSGKHSRGMAKSKDAMPGNVGRTYEVKSTCGVFNGADAKLLWKCDQEMDVDWQSPPRDVIQAVTRKLSKKFPYRN